MSFTTLSSLILLSASSVLGYHPFGYPGFQTQLSPLGPNLVYTSGSAADGLDLTDFSYFKNFGVVKSGNPFFKSEQLGAQDAKTDKKLETGSVANADVSTTVAPVNPKESKVTPAPEDKEKVDATTTSPDIKDADSQDPEVVVALINGQLLSGGSTGFGSPYPILRFGGSASYYPGLPTPFSGFSGFSGYSGYQAPDYFRPQYEPANDYFPYQSGNSPSYPSLDEDFYNPTFPFVYQHPGVATSTQTTTSSPAIDRRVNGLDDSKPKVEDKTGDETATATTEQILTKPDDTASEALLTAAESKEETTVADSAAVP